MAKKGKLPSDVVNAWPEIFKDITIDVVPIEYLHSVKVYFKDGKIWEIDVKKSLTKPNLNIENALEDLFEEYESSISNIDFRLDTAKVKRDIKKRTAVFMKKRK
tara:strand:- start:305 stop:616 length:312 start_codon:yes stop_codon:yes gene_type:complete